MKRNIKRNDRPVAALAGETSAAPGALDAAAVAGPAQGAGTPAGRMGSTPFMSQYLETKAKCPDALLFFRMGDFFELFFEDAQVAAKALDITLTYRGIHDGQPIPMAGVPHHSAEIYLSRLIRQGHRVAVCEQVEDPAEARKRGSKAVVRREIVRVITPGTVTEEGLLEARSPHMLVAVALGAGGREAGLAAADVSTGRLEVLPISTAQLGEALAALNPREVLAAEGTASAESLGSVLAPFTVTRRPDARSDPRLGERMLKSAYAISAIDAFGAFTRAELSACALLFDYLALTQAGGAARLDPPLRGRPEQELAIDPATRSSLEIERSAQGGRQGSLVGAIDRTVTGAGGRLLSMRIARPSRNRSQIEQRLDAVAHFVDAPDARAVVRANLKRTGDLERSRMRLMLRRGGPRDLLALAQGLRVAEEISASLRTGLLPTDGEVAAAEATLSMADKPELAAFAESVTAAILPDAPPVARDGGFVAPGFDHGLDKARALKENARGVIARLEADYVQRSGVQGLRIKHNNMLGYFIEASAKQAEALLRPPLSATFVHRQTMAGAVRFSTAELAELEGRIVRAESDALACETEIFQGFLVQVDALSPRLAAVAEALAGLDVAAGIAEWAVETGATRPEFDERPVLLAEGARHPVVEAALRSQGQGFTANDCRLDAGGESGPRLVLVTGPNMAGKSTFLRQNALLAILAQAGCYVPARRLRLGIADRVFSRVGASDDLSRGRSTFMVEMIETAAILNLATRESLVILDEVGRGTSTWDGMAIAWAVVEHLHDFNGCRALFATHYHQLCGLSETLRHCGNVSLRAQEWGGELVFLHEVAAGPADRSYGVQVARLAGLPAAAVRRAQAVLKRLEAQDGASTRPDTLPLFAALVETHALGSNDFAAAETAPSEAEQLLADTDPDTLTPREALDLVYRLKALLGT